MILEAIVTKLGTSFIDSFLGKATDLFKQYLNNQITKEQLHQELQRTIITSAKEMDTAHAASIAETQKAFFSAVAQSTTMQRAWAWVVYSQLAVLVWHQVGIPFVTLFGVKYPSSGTTVEWAYLLLATTLGAGAVLLRAGPAGLDLSKFRDFFSRRS